MAAPPTRREELTTLLDAFNRWILDMIEGNTDAPDLAPAFAIPTTETLLSVQGGSSYFPEFCRWEVSRRRGHVLGWRTEIKGPGRAVGMVQPKEALEFIQITATIGDPT